MKPLPLPVAERFRLAHADVRHGFGAQYPAELDRMKARLRAWMAKSGGVDPLQAALAIEAREVESSMQRLALAAGVELLAEALS